MPLKTADPQKAPYTPAYSIRDNGSSTLLHNRSFQSIRLLCIVSTTALVPLIGIAVWGGLNVHRPEGWVAFSGIPIAGKLTQPQAKAVDVLCGAVLAPLLMVGLNYVWFTTARIAAVNEVDEQSTTLGTLATVSSSSTGSYDIFTLWKLLIKSRSPRLILLGVLMLAAAICNSALDNVIAYEAYPQDAWSATVRLRSLHDSVVESGIHRSTAILGDRVPALYQFTDEQTVSFSQRFTGMLTGLSIANASHLLNGTEYHMINVISASLNGLDPKVTEVSQVPSTRYTIDCQATVPNAVNVLQQGEQSVAISFTTDGTTDFPQRYMRSYYSGGIATLQHSYNEDYSFLAFDQLSNSNLTYIGLATSFDRGKNGTDTPYGRMTPQALNMTTSGFKGTNAIISWWGMRCWMNITPGTIDLVRTLNSSWKQRNPVWAESNSQISKSWALRALQLALDYGALNSTLPGIGSALTMTAPDLSIEQSRRYGPVGWDYSTVALNLLYVEAETRRLIYETAAMDQSRALPGDFYELAVRDSRRFYRITYVPLILFAAIAAIITASSINLGLIWWTWRSASTKTVRKVDVLRLVVDAVAGLQKDTIFEDLRYASNSEIDAWAEAYHVRYEAEQDTYGSMRKRVVLKGVGTI